MMIALITPLTQVDTLAKSNTFFNIANCGPQLVSKGTNQRPRPLLVLKRQRRRGDASCSVVQPRLGL